VATRREMLKMKRIYKNDLDQAIYENACSCLYYGCGFSYLNYHSLTEKHAREIWKKAAENMAKEW
jgi:hypothetical protein